MQIIGTIKDPSDLLAACITRTGASIIREGANISTSTIGLISESLHAADKADALAKLADAAGVRVVAADAKDAAALPSAVLANEPADILGAILAAAKKRGLADWAALLKAAGVANLALEQLRVSFNTSRAVSRLAGFAGVAFAVIPADEAAGLRSNFDLKSRNKEGLFRWPMLHG